MNRMSRRIKRPKSVGRTIIATIVLPVVLGACGEAADHEPLLEGNGLSETSTPASHFTFRGKCSDDRAEIELYTSDKQHYAIGRLKAGNASSARIIMYSQVVAEFESGEARSPTLNSSLPGTAFVILAYKQSYRLNWRIDLRWDQYGDPAIKCKFESRFS